MRFSSGILAALSWGDVDDGAREVHKSRHTYEKIALFNAISSVFAVYVPCEPHD